MDSARLLIHNYYRLPVTILFKKTICWLLNRGKKQLIITLRQQNGGRRKEVSNSDVQWQIIRDFGKWPLNRGWPLNRRPLNIGPTALIILVQDFVSLSPLIFICLSRFISWQLIKAKVDLLTFVRGFFNVPCQPYSTEDTGDGAYGISSLSVKTVMSNHLQMWNN